MDNTIDHPVPAEPQDELAALQVHPGMANHVQTDSDVLSAVDAGLADLDAGRTLSLQAVAAKYRRTYRAA